MIDDPLSMLSTIIWLCAAGMYPVGFLFGACSPCCQRDDDPDDDGCPWMLSFDRCLSIGVTDSDPPDGADTPISLARFGGAEPFMSRASAPIEIHYVRSEIQFTLRLDLSASGASRTPVGSTRTQVWRFLPATISTILTPLSAYDTIGPPWHLQVDLSVTGVGTAAEAGVSSTLSVDEYGQPKVVLNVNQWTAAITHTETVTLYPTGLQRWAPSYLGQQNSVLRSTAVAASRVSGDAYSGWLVWKTDGLEVTQRSLAVRIVQSTLPFSLGVVEQRVFLDQDTAANFVAGEGSIESLATVSSVTSARTFRILPDNVACGVPESRVSVGIALGIYPRYMTLSVPQSWQDQYPSLLLNVFGAQWCGPNTLTMRSDGGGCAELWKPQYSRKGAALTLPTTEPSDFYSGRTLLWNLEQGPFRETFTKDTGHLWVISHGGSESGSVYDLPESGVCPTGTSFHGFGTCTPEFAATFDWEVNIEVFDEMVYGSNQNCTQVFESYTTKSATYSGSSSAVIKASGVTVADGKAILKFEGGVSGIVVAEQQEYPHFTECPESADPELVSYQSGVVIFPPWFHGGTFRFEAEVPCNDSGVLPLSFTGPSQETSGAFQVRVCEGGPNPATWNCTDTEAKHLYDTTNTLTGPSQTTYTSPRRTECSNWSQSVVGPSGVTLTRTCGDQYGGIAPQSVGTSIEYGQSRQRLARLVEDPSYVGSLGVTRQGECKLLSLSADSLTTVDRTTFLSATNGSCYYLRPNYGSGYDSGGAGDAVICGEPRATSMVPCDGCVLALTVVSGEENATVRFVTSGDKAGLIQLVALRTWASGEGVTFSVTCGDDTFEHTVRRA